MDTEHKPQNTLQLSLHVPSQSAHKYTQQRTPHIRYKSFEHAD